MSRRDFYICRVSRRRRGWDPRHVAVTWKAHASKMYLAHTPLRSESERGFTSVSHEVKCSQYTNTCNHFEANRNQMYSTLTRISQSIHGTTAAAHYCTAFALDLHLGVANQSIHRSHRRGQRNTLQTRHASSSSTVRHREFRPL